MVDMHGSFYWRLQTTDCFQQHRFPDAVGANEQNQTSGQQLQIDVLMQFDVAFWEAGGKVLEY